MAASKNTRILLLLPILLTAAEAQMKKSVVENDTITEVKQIFDEIEEDHDKLKKFFEEVILQEAVPDVAVKHGSRKEEEDCVCVPFYLCDQGSIVRDGSWLLQSRANTDVCENVQDICCSRPFAQTRMLSTSPNLECGHTSNTLEKPVEESPETVFGESPWTVIILTKRSKTVYTCTGSLIHPKVVLTAAHCVNTTESFIVRAGEWDVRKSTEPLAYQNRNVEMVIKHPRFKLHNLFYDVALLVLDEAFELDEHIRTACLTESAPKQLVTDIHKCITTGWGRNKATANYSGVMRKVKFSLVPFDKCQERLRTTRLGYYYELHQSFICADYQNDLDACEGNGGGPLMCPIAGQPGRFQQVGINSWGIDCANGNPAVFAKIAQVKDWVDEVFDELHYSKYSYTYHSS